MLCRTASSWLTIICVLAPLSLAQTCEVQSIVSSDSTSSGAFGESVSLDGNRAVVSDRSDSQIGTSAGAVHVYESPGAGWLATDKLTASDGVAQQQFGASVNLHANLVAVGATSDSLFGSNSGAVYVFRKTTGFWAQEAKLLAGDAEPSAALGSSVAVANDLIVSGATGAKDSSGFTTGAAYVFEVGPFGWIQTAKLLASDGSLGALFGAAVAVEEDRILVGAPRADPGSRGATYVFDRVGDTWVETAIISVGSTFEEFGTSVGLSGDRALIGAPFESSSFSNAGAAYVFEFDGASWNQTAKLQSSDLGSNDRFGWVVALDGSRAVVGALNASAAYSFELDGVWKERAKLSGPGSGSKSVGVSSDRAIVGNVGSASIFDVGSVVAPLEGCPGAISLSQGGIQTLLLQAGPSFAGSLYLVLGSMSGTAPGLPYGGSTIPLNPDSYFLYSLGNANNPPLLNTLGVLDASGAATAFVSIPQGFNPTLSGLTLDHAYGVLDPGTLALQFTSNPEQVTLIP